LEIDIDKFTRISSKVAVVKIKPESGQTAAISSRKPRILVVDDSAPAREGIAAIIGRTLRYTLCGSAVDRRSTIQLMEQYKPDVLLIEPFLGTCDGLFLIKEIAAQFPKTHILVISKQPEKVYAERVLRAGASGYWMKTGACEELIHAIETVIAGELYVSPGIALVAVHKLVGVRRRIATPVT
jgi:DNA-binding NarL/FixJ family response regulator